MFTHDSTDQHLATIRHNAIHLIRQWTLQPDSYHPHPTSTWHAPIILIDGRSGSGKSTIATALATELRIAGAHTIQLTGPDLWFPGWHGLAQGSATLEDLLTNPHRPAGFFQWDWSQNRWGKYHILNRSFPLLIEGCGALTPTTARAADLRIWVHADAQIRRERALTRDGETFAPFWQTWAEQEETHIRTHQPQNLADFLVSTSEGATGVGK